MAGVGAGGAPAVSLSALLLRSAKARLKQREEAFRKKHGRKPRKEEALRDAEWGASACPPARRGDAARTAG